MSLLYRKTVSCRVSYTSIDLPLSDKKPCEKEVYSPFDKKIVNTIGKGMPFSVRKTYIELKRAPYGMRCNGLSAFSLGLALRHILDKDYQWDNGQKTGTLDDSILAEIVESVVKDDGQNKMKNEKEICRLSTEAKIFIEKAPSMFGIVGDTVNARVEDVLLSIQNRVEEMSGRVPLWVLSHYIRCSGQAGAGDIAEALDAICFAGRTSSKSNNAIDRTDAIKKVGGLIRANPDFVNDAASFIKPDKFVTAFKSYLDEKAPHLVQLANQAGDRAYNQTVLAKAAESAGFLWNEEDIDAEINETIHEYDVICRVKDLSASVGVMPYGEAIEWLRKAIMQSNKLPKAFIANIEPSLEHVLTSIESGGAVRDIRDGIDKNFEVFKEWFFDDSRKKIVELLNRRLGNIGIQDSDLLDIYNSMPSMFTEAEAAFWERMRERIEIFSKDSRALNIKREWMRVTNSESPSEWGMNNGLPARFAIDAGHDSEDILAAVQTPEKYSIERLSELLTTMKELSPLEIADAQKHFIDVVIPKKYVKFNFGLASLLDFLRKKYGKAPNSWPMQPDIDEFLRAQYKGTFAPQVADRIKKISPEDLKKKVLRLTQESPDLGLLFWE